MSILKKLGKEILFFEGGMGTTLQKQGLMPGEKPEVWNITHPDIITGIHLDYLNAGCNIIKLNTFGANTLKFPDTAELKKIIVAAFQNAKKAIKLSGRENDIYIALDIGPTGRLLKPLGDMDFEDAVSIFGEVAKIASDIGCDLVLIETMNDLFETKAAVLGVKENCNLPIFVTNAYDKSGKLMTGATPEAVCATLEGLKVDAIGLNCSFGPREMEPIVKKLAKCSSLPIIVCPNAGLPTIKNGETVFDIGKTEFASLMADIVKIGVHIAGGCCGTTHEYMEEMIKKLKDITPSPVTHKNLRVISSYTNTVSFDDKPVIIGERINPTGKKLLKRALRDGDTDYILNMAISQEEAGADVLDVNVGLPEIDETETFKKIIPAIQTVTDLPLQIDTTNPKALEAALRLYNGKALINSVNGTKESMDLVFPLVKKYGGMVVALTLDEDGIPGDALGRYKIAQKIYKEAEKYGIGKNDIIADTLAMSISADASAANATLGALEKIHGDGCATILGVSNISFGLPKREFINSAFYTMALEKGLTAAIINPMSIEMMKAYKSFIAIKGLDENFSDYIDFASMVNTEQSYEENKDVNNSDICGLKGAITKGLSAAAKKETIKLLEERDPLDIINDEIIPALDTVGKGFEEKTVYLPQLLISAEAASTAFEQIKLRLSENGKMGNSKCTFVIATVKGDIHDIGKNIVKVILENYGFNVIDLGKDVAPEVVVKEAKKNDASIVGLSALMTTTVPAMEETVNLIKKELPHIKTIVGGAVMTEEYARMIGADKYASDAMETVRYAEIINAELIKNGTCF